MFSGSGRNQNIEILECDTFNYIYMPYLCVTGGRKTLSCFKINITTCAHTMRIVAFSFTRGLLDNMFSGFPSTSVLLASNSCCESDIMALILNRKCFPARISRYANARKKARSEFLGCAMMAFPMPILELMCFQSLFRSVAAHTMTLLPLYVSHPITHVSL